MLGELSQKYPAESTENANAEEKTVSREELVKNVNKAQDAYDIAEEEYNASKTLVESYKAEMDSYAASRNGTRAVVDRFFRNIERFYREYIDKNFEEKLNNLILRDSDGEEAVINISELYADLLQRSIEESVEKRCK